jgi:hypothetical protein
MTAKGQYKPDTLGTKGQKTNRKLQLLSIIMNLVGEVCALVMMATGHD